MKSTIATIAVAILLATTLIAAQTKDPVHQEQQQHGSTTSGTSGHNTESQHASTSGHNTESQRAGTHNTESQKAGTSGHNTESQHAQGTQWPSKTYPPYTTMPPRPTEAHHRTGTSGDSTSTGSTTGSTGTTSDHEQDRQDSMIVEQLRTRSNDAAKLVESTDRKSSMYQAYVEKAAAAKKAFDAATAIHNRIRVMRAEMAQMSAEAAEQLKHSVARERAALQALVQDHQQQPKEGNSTTTTGGDRTNHNSEPSAPYTTRPAYTKPSMTDASRPAATSRNEESKSSTTDGHDPSRQGTTNHDESKEAIDRNHETKPNYPYTTRPAYTKPSVSEPSRPATNDESKESQPSHDESRDATKRDDETKPAWSTTRPPMSKPPVSTERQQPATNPDQEPSRPATNPDQEPSRPATNPDGEHNNSNEAEEEKADMAIVNRIIAMKKDAEEKAAKTTDEAEKKKIAAAIAEIRAKLTRAEALRATIKANVAAMAKADDKVKATLKEKIATARKELRSILDKADEHTKEMEPVSEADQEKKDNEANAKLRAKLDDMKTRMEKMTDETAKRAMAADVLALKTTVARADELLATIKTKLAALARAQDEKEKADLKEKIATARKALHGLAAAENKKEMEEAKEKDAEKQPDTTTKDGENKQPMAPTTPTRDTTKEGEKQPTTPTRDTTTKDGENKQPTTPTRDGEKKDDTNTQPDTTKKDDDNKQTTTTTTTDKTETDTTREEVRKQVEKQAELRKQYEEARKKAAASQDAEAKKKLEAEMAELKKKAAEEAAARSKALAEEVAKKKAEAERLAKAANDKNADEATRKAAAEKLAKERAELVAKSQAKAESEKREKLSVELDEMRKKAESASTSAEEKQKLESKIAAVKRYVESADNENERESEQEKTTYVPPTRTVVVRECKTHKCEDGSCVNKAIECKCSKEGESRCDDGTCKAQCGCPATARLCPNVGCVDKRKTCDGKVDVEALKKARTAAKDTCTKDKPFTCPSSAAAGSATTTQIVCAKSRAECPCDSKATTVPKIRLSRSDASFRVEAGHPASLTASAAWRPCGVNGDSAVKFSFTVRKDGEKTDTTLTDAVNKGSVWFWRKATVGKYIITATATAPNGLTATEDVLLNVIDRTPVCKLQGETSVAADEKFVIRGAAENVGTNTITWKCCIVGADDKCTACTGALAAAVTAAANKPYIKVAPSATSALTVGKHQLHMTVGSCSRTTTVHVKAAGVKVVSVRVHGPTRFNVESDVAFYAIAAAKDAKFQWQLNGVDVKGATSRSLKIKAADSLLEAGIPSKVICKVTAGDATGEGALVVNPVQPPKVTCAAKSTDGGEAISLESTIEITATETDVTEGTLITRRFGRVAGNRVQMLSSFGDRTVATVKAPVLTGKGDSEDMTFFVESKIGSMMSRAKCSVKVHAPAVSSEKVVAQTEAQLDAAATEKDPNALVSSAVDVALASTRVTDATTKAAADRKVLNKLASVLASKKREARKKAVTDKTSTDVTVDTKDEAAETLTAAAKENIVTVLKNIDFTKLRAKRAAEKKARQDGTAVQAPPKTASSTADANTKDDDCDDDCMESSVIDLVSTVLASSSSDSTSSAAAAAGTTTEAFDMKENAKPLLEVVAPLPESAEKVSTLEKLTESIAADTEATGEVTTLTAEDVTVTVKAFPSSDVAVNAPEIAAGDGSSIKVPSEVLSTDADSNIALTTLQMDKTSRPTTGVKAGGSVASDKILEFSVVENGKRKALANLPKMIELRMKVKAAAADDATKKELRALFWDTVKQQWDDKGCQVKSVEKATKAGESDIAVVETSHTTNFAVASETASNSNPNTNTNPNLQPQVASTTAAQSPAAPEDNSWGTGKIVGVTLGCVVFVAACVGFFIASRASKARKAEEQAKREKDEALLAPPSRHSSVDVDPRLARFQAEKPKERPAQHSMLQEL